MSSRRFALLIPASIALGTMVIPAGFASCRAADTVESTGANSSPSTAAPLFADDFESGRLQGANGFEWCCRNAVVSRDIAHSGSWALKFSFGPVEPDGDPHWWTEQRFNLPGPRKELWVEYYIYYPNGREGLGSAAMKHGSRRADNNKFFRLWGGGQKAYGGNVNKVGMSTRRSGILFEYTKEGSRGTGHFDAPPAVPWQDDLGRWIQVRMYYKHVSARGAADGVMRLWKDGKLLVDFRNVNQAWSSDAPYWDSGYFMGYDNARFEATTFIYIDDVKFYYSDPGWK